jgi:DNA topoisomerase-1
VETEHQAEHVAAAEAAGLTYVTDTRPGITRKGAGKGFAYYKPNGTLIRDRAERQRLTALRIPPAWTDVWICPNPRGHLQATARDAKGRKQYRYHPKFRAMRDESKFGRMLMFSEVLPRLREKVECDLSLPGLPRRKLLATLVRLLNTTLIRVGNDEYRKTNRSYGLTTLRRQHVEVSGYTLHFEFHGKSGVWHSVDLIDQRLARIVRQLQDMPGQELFKYVDGDGKRHGVDSDDVNDYLRLVTRRDVTAKDFRTWSGTMLVARALWELGPPSSKQEAKKNVNTALDQVAARLGNTRAVCRKYYVHPAIIEAYSQEKSLPAPQQRRKALRPTAALRREEVAVLQFLQREIARKTRRR